MAAKDDQMTAFMKDFAAGGISGAVAKTCTAPIERVKLIIQTQDSNPMIRSGEVKRYTGIADCFKRVASEQGIGAFWRGNFTNVLRYFPTQAFNFAFKDIFKNLFPKYDKKKEFGMFFLANGLLSAISDNVFVATVYINEVKAVFDAGDITREHFDKLVIAINTGTPKIIFLIQLL